MGAAAIPLVLMAAATVVQTAGTLKQGQAASAAAKFERQQYEEEAENARVAALQDENARRADLRAVLAAQEVYFGANGLDPNSPTAQALRDETIGLAEEDIATSKLNFANRVRRNQLAAGQAGIAAKSAKQGAYFSAAAGLLQFGSRAMSMGGAPGGGAPAGMYNGGTGTNSMTGMRYGGV